MYEKISQWRRTKLNSNFLCSNLHLVQKNHNDSFPLKYLYFIVVWNILVSNKINEINLKSQLKAKLLKYHLWCIRRPKLKLNESYRNMFSSYLVHVMLQYLRICMIYYCVPNNITIVLQLCEAWQGRKMWSRKILLKQMKQNL